MPSSFTTNKGYELMATGEQNNVWGIHLNTIISTLDLNMGGNLIVPVSSSNVTLSAAQAENVFFSVTGTLTSNVAVIFPAVGGFYVVKNGTSGAFTVTAKTPSGTGVVVPQGSTIWVYSDGTNVYSCQNALVGGAIVGGTIDNAIIGSITPAAATVTNLTVTGTATGVPTVPTGALLPFAGVNAPSGFLLAQGQAVSRTTYATLFNVVASATTGTTNGTTLVSSVASTAGFQIGFYVSGPNITAGTTIAGFTVNSITLSIAATGSAVGQAITVSPYPLGDGSTTFNLPDLQGRQVLGAGAGSGLTTRILGAKVGSETVTISQAMLPNVNFSGTCSGTTGNDSPAHTHNFLASGGTVGGLFDNSNSGSATYQTAGGTRLIISPSATQGPNTNHTHSISGTASVASGGSGTAAPVVDPTLVLNYIIKT